MSATIVPRRTLVLVWAALLALLFLTWGLAQVDLRQFSSAVALLIALLKMLLVVLFFMHVKYKPPLTWIFVAAGFVWFLIMIDLTLTDYWSRSAVPGTGHPTWKHGSWPAPNKQQPGPTPAPDVSPHP